MSEKQHPVAAVVNELRDLKRHSHIDWRAPTLMGSSFFAGILFMAGHHALYLVVNGSAAGDASLQLWIIRAGTAFAFLSKLLLAIGTAVAYDQWLWVDLHANPHEMASLDSLFGIIGNGFNFLQLRIWIRRPALTFLAAVTWLLPLSAVLTPGTLSVQPVELKQNTTLDVPERAYTTSTNLYCGTRSDENSTSYLSMATGLLNPTFATVLANNVLPVHASSNNLTYNLPFYGPAISCTPSEDGDFQLAQDAISQYENSTQSRVFYYGWVPQAGWGASVNGSFFASTDVQIANVRLDVESEDAARIFIYLNTTGVDDNGTRTAFHEAPSAQMITCMLYNSSYETQFNVRSSGEQKITAETRFQNWMPALASVNAPDSDPSVRIQMNMQAVMEAFGMMASGSIVFAFDESIPSVNSVYALGMNPAMYPGRPDLTQSEMTQRMMDQSEALFRNITLSMRYGVVGGISGPERTSVGAEASFSESQFVYEPRTLLIAYGLNTLFSLACVTMGVHAVLHNGASYANTFSTIVRVTRDPMLSRLVEGEGDLQGAQPTPSHIRRAEVRLGRSAKSSPSYSSSWS